MTHQYNGELIKKTLLGLGLLLIPTIFLVVNLVIHNDYENIGGAFASIIVLFYLIVSIVSLLIAFAFGFFIKANSKSKSQNKLNRKSLIAAFILIVTVIVVVFFLSHLDKSNSTIPVQPATNYSVSFPNSLFK